MAQSAVNATRWFPQGMEWVAEWVQKAAVQGFHYIRIWAQLWLGEGG
eukprot:CAMPEP_0174285714 /NCGR_PEP_ID=MMETSP0809-20121228/9496_1 /TAXON_ID=73025 ORGANISM="Eutreptiella gymnastica-like, Strain CCMP1594" /NCGR_SAMPLE_ID=MMETSP0809 /ASSEMBLY_ACC=CAM_ASM_000658 /LENGTH=46 /DNA_ID= /DNA_START= /DNA_END= /DNA_ORIENTATION=